MIMPRHWFGERIVHDAEISKNSLVLRIAETGHPDHPDLDIKAALSNHQPFFWADFVRLEWTDNTQAL